MKTSSTIEALESRIAPATIVLPAGNTLTYIDVDGDAVTVKISVGTLDAADFTFDTAFASTAPQQLRFINFSGDVAKNGTNLSIVATPSDFDGDGDLDGDGFANVGSIEAAGIDLGTVTLDGDLGRIIAGNTTVTNPGVKSLTVNSLGRMSFNTGAPNLDSVITGALGALTVKTDVVNASLTVDDTTPGVAPFDGVLTIGVVKIGGRLVGGSVTGSGSIFAQGDIRSVFVGGGIYGGDGAASGAIVSDGKILLATIGGSIEGGDGDDSGRLRADNGFGTLLVKGSVKGGLGERSGQIIADDLKSTKVTVNGSVIGGAGDGSGTIDGGDRGFELLTVKGSVIGGTANSTGVLAGGYLGTVVIEGDLRGGDITGADSTAETGIVKSFTTIKKLTIGGSIIAGEDDSTGSLTTSGAILAYDDIQSLTVKGGIHGTVGTSGTTRAAIVARGQDTPSATRDVALGTLTVLGSVTAADVLAGYRPDFLGAPTADNPDAEIGKVNVTGDWAESNLVAGVASGGNGFGNSLDAVITGGTTLNDPARISRISSVIIKGQALGTFGGVDAFGFVADQIGSFKVGKRTLVLSAAPAVIDAFPLGITGDVNFLEI